MTKRTDVETLKKADWDGVEKEVVVRIRLLKAMAEHLEPNEVSDRIAEDLILPAMELIAAFCTRIEIGEEGEG